MSLVLLTILLAIGWAAATGSFSLLNLLFGALYTVIISITMWTSAHFIFFGLIEIALTLLAIFYAWTWPRKV